MYSFLFFSKNNNGDIMVKTGMTRRIDELGRLVIPKEIRKNLKIKDNDQVEITVIDNKIILNKHDNIEKDRIISIILNSLKKEINKNVLITSRDNIIDYSLINKEIINDLSLNSNMMNIIENRNSIINIHDKEYICSVFPIIINGDLYGSLMINGDKEITSNELEVIKYSQKILENYLE